VLPLLLQPLREEVQAFSQSRPQTKSEVTARQGPQLQCIADIIARHSIEFFQFPTGMKCPRTPIA
jgi:hypothetical protein